MDQKFEKNIEMAKRFPGSPGAKGLLSKRLITHVTDRAGHDRRYAIDAKKISSHLGYVPEESFETGIKKTLDWYLENEMWWRHIMDKSYLEWVNQNYTS